MNTIKFKEIYTESRNGCNHYVRHMLMRNTLMSDGLAELADTGCWWWIDIIASELTRVMRKHGESLLICKAHVINDMAYLSAIGAEDAIRWTRKINFTDMPAGTWCVYLADEGDKFVAILPSEY